MDPLNDLVWNDEDEGGVSPAFIEGPPMPQICTVSDPCSNGSGGSPAPDPYVAGSYDADIGCGC